MKWETRVILTHDDALPRKRTCVRWIKRADREPVVVSPAFRLSEGGHAHATIGMSAMKTGERISNIDRSGESFETGLCTASDGVPLCEMYRLFVPKPASQGLPPKEPESCHRWVKQLLEIGGNVLAWKGDKVIGHASLIPDRGGKSAEFVIFVDQDYRNRGIGTELTRVTLEEARTRGFDSVWLSVEVSNYIAIRLYKKVGFEFCDEDTCERIMIVRL